MCFCSMNHIWTQGEGLSIVFHALASVAYATECSQAVVLV